MIDLIRKAWDCTLVGGRGRIAAIVAVVVIASALEAIGVGLAFAVVSVLLAGDLTGQSGVVASILVFSGLNETTFKAAVLAGFVVLFLLKGTFAIFAQFWQMDYVNRNMAAAAERLQAKILEMPYLEFAQRDSSDFLSLQEHAIPQAFTNVIFRLMMILAEGLTVAAIVVALLFVAPVMTILTVGLLSAVLGLYFLGFHRRAGHLGAAYLDAKRTVLRLAREQLLNAKQIRIHDRAGYFVPQFGRAKLKQTRLETVTKMLQYIPRTLAEMAVVTIVMGWVIVIVVSGWPLDDVIPTVGAFAVAALRLLPSSQRIVTAMTALRIGYPALYQVWRELNRTGTMPAGKGDAADSDPIAGVGAAIQLTGVSFSYPTSTVPAIHDVTLEIRRGQAVAVVGPSGAGKSTLVDLILGLLPPTDGRITVDGHDISAVAGSWRRCVGYVPQTIFLSNSTLRENIAFGFPPSRIDEGAVRRAVEFANLRRVVDELPEGLDTVVGEMGDRLSGGQRQRVGIARALYHDPDVLILDEATSALDLEAEQIISETIQSLRGKKTLIIVAHQPALVRGCDRVFVLEEGRIRRVGTPTEILGLVAALDRRVS